MDVASQRVGRDQSDRPQHQEYHKDRPQHGWLPSQRWRVHLGTRLSSWHYDKSPKEIVKYLRSRDRSNVHSWQESRESGLVAIVGGNRCRALPIQRAPSSVVYPVAGDTQVVIGNGHAIA